MKAAEVLLFTCGMLRQNCLYVEVMAMAPTPEEGVMASCSHVADSSTIAAATVAVEFDPRRSQMQNW